MDLRQTEQSINEIDNYTTQLMQKHPRKFQTDALSLNRAVHRFNFSQDLLTSHLNDFRNEINF